MELNPTLHTKSMGVQLQSLDLDQLYTQILSVYPSKVNIVQVLGIIFAIDENYLPDVIEDILEMEEGELKLVLRVCHP